jgi:EEF1A N-terminal glycine/lysine methyltransferase
MQIDPEYHAHRIIKSTIDSEDPEDILSASLGILYDYTPITLADNGGQFVYTHTSLPPQHLNGSTHNTTSLSDSAPLVLSAPNTHAKNWALHASSIWASAVFVAQHIDEIDLHGLSRLPKSSSAECSTHRRFDVLELGAGAGLPGLFIAKCLERIQRDREFEGRADQMKRWTVTLSDYPDDLLTKTLVSNAKRNGFNASMDADGTTFSCPVRVCPYAWGADPAEILGLDNFNNCLEDPSQSDSVVGEDMLGYDLILATDTLWNAALHKTFANTLANLLKPSKDSRIHLIAGFHTGRYSILGFLRILESITRTNSRKELRMTILRAEECHFQGGERRQWSGMRDGEDEAERRRWLVWIEAGWTEY